MKIKFDRFHANENEQYLFLPMPLMLIKDDSFKNLSDSAKILYSLLLNRTSLSSKNNWIDENGDVYIIYTLKEIEEDLNCCEQKALKSMKELKDIGLIESIRQGLNKPNIIYVMNFATELKYGTKNINDFKSPIISRNNDFHGSRTMKIENQEPCKSRTSNTNSNNNNLSNTDISIYPAQNESENLDSQPTEQEPIDLIDNNDIEIIRETVADKICLGELLYEYHGKEDKINELYEAVCDVLTDTTAPTIRVGKRQLPAITVKQAFVTLGKKHMIYVLRCLEDNSGNIKNNAKGYIITALYNSVHTVGIYKPPGASAFRGQPRKPKQPIDVLFEKAVKKSMKLN